jgi:hypothetical protein
MKLFAYVVKATHEQPKALACEVIFCLGKRLDFG